jgi:GT2 family glycosyltransferase
MVADAAEPAEPLSVLVSILAFHTAGTSPRCLASVLAQDYDGLVEVVVRDQGGDEAERAALQAVVDGGPAGRPVALEVGENLGFAGGHDATIGNGRGELVLVLNADAWLDPGFLRAAVPAFADPTVGAVQGLVIRADDDVVDTAGLEPRRNREVRSRGAGDPVAAVAEPTEVWGVDGAVALYRRGALHDVALPPGPEGEVFDASFFAYKEDVDLAWRLRRRGWSARYVPSARATHVRSARPTTAGRWRAGADLSRLADRNGFVNHRLVQVKNERFGELLRALGPWLLRELGAWIRLPLREPFPFWAPAGILRGLPSALRKRRVIRRRTTVVDDRRWFR